MSGLFPTCLGDDAVCARRASDGTIEMTGAALACSDGSAAAVERKPAAADGGALTVVAVTRILAPEPAVGLTYEPCEDGAPPECAEGTAVCLAGGSYPVCDTEPAVCGRKSETGSIQLVGSPTCAGGVASVTKNETALSVDAVPIHAYVCQDGALPLCASEVTPVCPSGGALPRCAFAPAVCAGASNSTPVCADGTKPASLVASLEAATYRTFMRMFRPDWERGDAGEDAGDMVVAIRDTLREAMVATNGTVTVELLDMPVLANITLQGFGAERMTRAFALAMEAAIAEDLQVPPGISVAMLARTAAQYSPIAVYASADDVSSQIVVTGFVAAGVRPESVSGYMFAALSAANSATATTAGVPLLLGEPVISMELSVTATGDFAALPMIAGTVTESLQLVVAANEMNVANDGFMMRISDRAATLDGPVRTASADMTATQTAVVSVLTALLLALAVFLKWANNGKKRTFKSIP
jgi:hypothetical protein